jgi:hypothetical protein
MVLAMLGTISLSEALEAAKISTASEYQATTTQCHQPWMEIRLTILFVKNWLSNVHVQIENLFLSHLKH